MMEAAERILIFDFGSQYGQLIARRVREQNVFCQIVRHDLTAARITELAPRGIILSGGPASVYDNGAPRCDPAFSDPRDDSSNAAYAGFRVYDLSASIRLMR